MAGHRVAARSTSWDMSGRLLVLGAGTAATNNFVRSLRDGDSTLGIIGCHDDRFVLKRSTADRNYLIPSATRPAFVRALCRIIRAERITLVIPNSDADVRTIARLRSRLPCRVFLPSMRSIELCQNKYRLNQTLAGRGVPVPATVPVRDLAGVAALFRRVARGSRAWCRIGRGTGSIGAVPVTSPEQARTWIRCWAGLRGIRPSAFLLSEYLPGRDFGCITLWRDGGLVLAKTCERLSYLGAGAYPGRVSSVAMLAKTVNEPGVVQICVDAVRAADPRPTGAFSVDLRENAHGVPCVTEINVGRLSSGLNIFDVTGKHNLALTFVRLGLGQPSEITDPYDVVEDYYMLRDVDTLPAIFHADDFFDGIEEVWR